MVENSSELLAEVTKPHVHHYNDTNTFSTDRLTNKFITQTILHHIKTNKSSYPMGGGKLYK